MQSRTTIQLCDGKTPEQNDSWSCGHRVILYAASLLQQGWADQVLETDGPFQPFDIMDDDVASFRLQSLCEGDNSMVDGKCIKAEPLPFVKAEARFFVKTEAKEPTAPKDQAPGTSATSASASEPRVSVQESSKPEKREGSIPAMSVPTPVRASALPNSVKPESTSKPATPANCPATSPPNEEDSESDSTVSEGMKEYIARVQKDLERQLEGELSRYRRTKKQLQAEMEEKQTKEELDMQQETGIKKTKNKRQRKKLADEDLGQSIEKIMSQRAAKKLRMKQISFAKDVLTDAGVNYNQHFQALHKSLLAEACPKQKLPKGHWEEFLLGIAGEQEISCKACRALMIRHDLGKYIEDRREKERSHADQSLPKTGATATEPQSTPCLEIVPYVPQASRAISPPRKRARAGRPARGEGASFNIWKFCEESRPGVYKRLSEDEAMGPK